MSKPQHKKVSDWLRDQIQSKFFAIDEKLPSESDLCSKFEISRLTVRRALQTLEAEGFIYKRQGLGSFVSPPKARHTLAQLTDFDEEMLRAGLQPESKVLALEFVAAPKEIAERLGVGIGDKVVELRRVRLGSKTPVAIDVTWLPVFYGQLIHDEDLAHQTLFQIFEGKYNIPIVRGRYCLEAKVAEPDCAQALNVEVGFPVLVLHRFVQTVEEKTLFYQQRFYRADRIRFELDMERAIKGSRIHENGDMLIRSLTPTISS